MSDAAQWAEVSAIAAIVAVVIAFFSRSDSNRSASASERSALASERSSHAAEKSVYEVRQAKKIAKAELLAPHFGNALYLLEVAAGKKRKNDDQIEPGMQSFQTLISITQDAELKEIYSEFPEAIKKRNVSIFEVLGDGSAQNKHSELQSLTTRMNECIVVFERKQREYLHIGE